jgi:putative nucleotidyltransferase with HDIG domain
MNQRPSTNKDRVIQFLKKPVALLRKNKFLWIALIVSFCGAALIIVFALQFEQLFPRYNLADFKPAGVAPYEIVSERDIVWVDEEKTARKRAEAERSAVPVFQYDEDKTGVILDKFRIFREFLTTRKGNGADTRKSLLHQNLGINRLLSERVFASLQSLAPADLTDLLDKTGALLLEALDRGILAWAGIDRDPVSLKTVAITHGTGTTRITSERNLDEIITRQSLPTWLDGKAATLKYQVRESEYAKTIILALADENVAFNLAATEAARQKARDTVPPVQELLRKNFPIVGKGQTITAETYSKLLAFSVSAKADLAFRTSGTLLFLALIFLTAVFLFGNTLARRTFTRGETLFLILLGVVYLCLSVLVLRLLPFGRDFPLTLFLPTAMITVLATIIISPYAGIAYSFLLAAIAFLVQNEMTGFLFAFFSGLAGTAAVLRVQKRIDLVKAGFVLFFVQGLIMAVISILNAAPWEETVPLAAGAALNGFFTLILTLGFLPLVEHGLNSPTRFRLMELSDTNVPLLKRMLVLAPGTYTHSINVANLAESAAIAVTANALLARVGGYYHDIGKVDQPEYFIENQDALNKHDFLKPSLSAAVIKSHVKIGVEKAKELNLPQAVIDIIGQHHGKGLISFFFSRAKAENTNGETISPEDYSYQGTRPQTKEAAIVMLADAVEAASRSLKKPTPAKIEKLVWHLIEERFHTEELLECSLTLHELEVIKRVFVSIVQGYLHQRIQYPKTSGNGA